MAGMALMNGCGVKGPPIAIERKEPPIPLQLDCSPYDVKCDERDSEYQANLDPANPKDAARIRQLELAWQKRKAQGPSAPKKTEAPKSP